MMCVHKRFFLAVRNEFKKLSQSNDVHAQNVFFSST